MSSGMLLYGLKDGSILSKDDVGEMFSVSGERIRQLNEMYLKSYKKLIKAGQLKTCRIRLNEESRDELNKFIDIISSKTCFVINQLETKLSDSINFKNQEYAYFKLFLSSLDYTEVPTHITSTWKDTFFVSNNIDSAQYFKKARAVVKVLNYSGIPLTTVQVITSLRKSRIEISLRDVKDILESVYNIQLVREGEDFNRNSYQLRFDYLSSVGLMGLRILFQKSRPTDTSILLEEVIKCLFMFGEVKEYDIGTFSRSMSQTGKVGFKGKTSTVTLKSWGDNTDSMTDLIKSILFENNKPMNLRSIVDKALVIRPNLNEKSIRTIVHMDYVKLESGKYILPLWAKRYKDQVPTEKNKPTRSEVAIEVFNSFGRDVERIEFVNILEQERGWTRAIGHSVVRRKYLFSSYKSNGKTFLKLVEKNASSEKLIKDQIASCIENILKTYDKGNCELRVIVQEVRKYGYQSPSIYKVIDNYHTQFRKYKLQDKIYIKLLGGKVDSPVSLWSMVSKELELLVGEEFNDPRQPSYSISLKSAISCIKEFSNYLTSEPRLNDLSQTLLPSIIAYFNNKNSKSDLLTILKELLTNLDPFLKKLLLLVDYASYTNVINNKKGLGSVINKLQRIDPMESRYKGGIRSAPLINFGKHIWTVYHYRNDRVHNASTISINDIHNIIKSCFVFYLYTIFEYSIEIDEVLS